MDESTVDLTSTDSSTRLPQLKPKSGNIQSTVGFQLLTDHINANCSTEANLNFLIGKNNIVQTSYVPPLQSNICVQKENQVFTVNDKEVLNIENVPLRLCNMTGEVIEIESKPENKTNTINIIDNKPLQFTTIPLCPTTNNQIQIQNDVPDVLKWNPNSNGQTIIIVPPNNNLQSTDKPLKDCSTIAPNIINNVVNLDNQKEIKTLSSGIIYRIVNPEDLNLFDPTKKKTGVKRPNILAKIVPKKKLKLETLLMPVTSTPSVQSAPKPPERAKPKPIQPKKSVQSTALKCAPQTQLDPSPKAIPTTRCGRSVRPPRHITTNYEQVKENSDNVDLEITKNEKFPAESIKQKHICPTCKKVYFNIKRIGLHLFSNPNHATSPKSIEILTYYKNEVHEKKIIKVDAECQTMECDILQKVDDLKESKKHHKSPNNNVKMDKEREDRSLFKFFIRVLQKTAPEHRANIFIRQLAILTVKLRKLLPCLLQKSENNSLCTINDPVAKILDLSPGNYNLNMDAVVNVKTQSGSSKHSKHSLSESTTFNPTIPFENLWSDKNKECELKIDNHNCIETSHVNEWASPVQKPKWIPIGSDNPIQEPLNVTSENWISSDVLINDSTFNPANDTIKTWEANIHEHDLKSSESTETSWIANTIGELAKINIVQEIDSQNHILNTNGILTPSVNSATNGDALEFNCKDKMVDIHSDLVFGVQKDILPIDNIASDSAVCVSNSNGSDNFDFSNSHFDIQIDTNKLNFSDTQFSDLKYGGDTLPPFRKIEPKTLQLPESLNDITSDTDKFHISSDDSILNASNYPVNSETLDLSMDTSQINTLDNIVNSCDIAKTIVSNEDTLHCSSEALLSNAELNLPISVSNTLNANESILSVSESSLDDNRLNLSSSQSVLNLLDPLTSDCLSFSDSDLNPRTSFEFEFLKFGETD